MIKPIKHISRCGNIKRKWSFWNNHVIRFRYINYILVLNKLNISRDFVSSINKNNHSFKAIMKLEKKSSSLILADNEIKEKEIMTLISPYSLDDYDISIFQKPNIKNINDITLLRKNVLPNEIITCMENKWDWVRGIKYPYNKSSFNIETYDNLSLVITPQVKLLKDTEIVKILTPEFCLWLVGFTDAEGTFKLYKNKQKISFVFSFEIKLHQDDVGVLIYIQKKLGVGKIYSAFRESERCFSYIVRAHMELINVILPIFDTYPLLTIKALQYKHWREAIEIKINSGSRKTLNTLEVINIIELKNKINKDSPQDLLNWSNINNGIVTGPWLVGFTEGDGSFMLNNTKPGFYIGQHSKSKKTLLLILNYFKNLYDNDKLVSNSNSDIPLFKNVDIKKKNNQEYCYLSITNRSNLYYYILPFYMNQKFYSRKEIDFKLWVVVLILFALKQNTTSVGIDLLDNISSNINNHRYSTYIKSDREIKYKLNLDLINNTLITCSENLILSDVKPKLDYSTKMVYIFKNKQLLCSRNTITETWNYLKEIANYPYTLRYFSMNKNSFKVWKDYSWFTQLDLLKDKGYILDKD